MKDSTKPPRKKDFQSLARRFASLTQSGCDGVLIYGAGIILNATPGAAALFGRTPRDLNRCSIADLVTTASRHALQRLEDAPGESCPALAVREDGLRVPIEVTVKARVTLCGRRLFVLALRDVRDEDAKPHLTDRKLR